MHPWGVAKESSRQAVGGILHLLNLPVRFGLAGEGPGGNGGLQRGSEKAAVGRAVRGCGVQQPDHAEGQEGHVRFSQEVRWVEDMSTAKAVNRGFAVPLIVSSQGLWAEQIIRLKWLTWVKSTARSRPGLRNKKKQICRFLENLPAL